jgi:DAACS family dicarboxylate/amino acid:cation (Na+ or H+) symporter
MRPSLSVQMLAGLLLGTALGIASHLLWRESPGLQWFIANVTDPVGKVFLRLLFMLVVPLIFSALALGVVGVGDMRSLGRIGLKTLAYTVCVSFIAVLIGVALVNLFRPGAGLPPELRETLHRTAAQGSALMPKAGELPKGGLELLVGIVPDNPVRAMANGDMLAVMFFSLMVGIGIATTRTAAAERFKEAIEGLYDVVIRLIGIVIRVAPIGVAALLFTLTARLGYDVLRQLGQYVLVVVLGLALHQFGVYSLAVRLLGGMSPRRFFSGVRDAMVTAFSTASSNATLPTSLKVAEENLRLPPHVSRFVLTLGSTANQNGTALFEGVTVLFLAQFYGVELGFAQQLLVVMICVLGGIGTAGVPAGSIPVIVMILGMVGVPPEGIGMILGVDRFLDMCRTTLNVTGDLAAAVVISRGEAPPLAADIG